MSKDGKRNLFLDPQCFVAEKLDPVFQHATRILGYSNPVLYAVQTDPNDQTVFFAWVRDAGRDQTIGLIVREGQVIAEFSADQKKLPDGTLPAITRILY